jgi:hypothetical protein
LGQLAERLVDQAEIYAVAANRAGEGPDGEPRSGVAGFAIEAGELLFGDVFKIAGHWAGKSKPKTAQAGITDGMKKLDS